MGLRGGFKHVMTKLTYLSHPFSAHPKPPPNWGLVSGVCCHWARFPSLAAPLPGTGLLPAPAAEARWMPGAETGAQGGQGRGSVTRSLITTPREATDHHVLLTNKDTEALRNASVRPDCAPPWPESEAPRASQGLPDRTNIDRTRNPTAAKCASPAVHTECSPRQTGARPQNKPKRSLND